MVAIVSKDDCDRIHSVLEAAGILLASYYQEGHGFVVRLDRSTQTYVRSRDESRRLRCTLVLCTRNSHGLYPESVWMTLGNLHTC